MHPPILCATDVWRSRRSLSPPAIQGEVIVERGVVVGGLMICGSFLLAAMLNRSAMEERPVPATVVPVAPVSVQPVVTPGSADCADVSTRADAQGSAAGVQPSESDLMVNGRAACPR